MELFEAILSRRSTRCYRQIPVEREKLEKVLEAGRFAPSGGNNQSCHFLVVQKAEVLRNLISLVEKAFAKMELHEGLYKSLKNSIEKSQKGGYVFCYDAPALIIVANQKDYGNAMADSACAIENMMLEANALDLGSCWINQLRWLSEEPSLVDYLQSLGMRPEERVFGSVVVGYPDSESGMPMRKPLARKGNEVLWI